MTEIVKLYERVERKYRPESWRLKAIQTEEENQELREQAARDRNRIADLERQLKELGPRRRRRRRNNPPQG